MLYRGFNKAEMDRITKILDHHQVHYELSSDFEEVAKVDNAVKQEVNMRQLARRDSSFYQIKIEKEEFKKLSPHALQSLYDLRIYEEQDSPFTEEELSKLGEPSDKHLEAKSRKPHKYEKIWSAVTLIAMCIAAYFYLQKFFRNF